MKTCRTANLPLGFHHSAAIFENFSTSAGSRLGAVAGASSGSGIRRPILHRAGPSSMSTPRRIPLIHPHIAREGRARALLETGRGDEGLGHGPFGDEVRRARRLPMSSASAMSRAMSSARSRPATRSRSWSPPWPARPTGWSAGAARPPPSMMRANMMRSSPRASR